VASCSHGHAINYHIRRGCEIDRNFLDDCNLVVFSLYIHSSIYNFFTSLILAAPFYPGHRRDRIVLQHRLMSRLLYICLLLNILFLVLAQLRPFVSSSSSHFSESLTVPMPPRHTSYEYSCVCGAGFTQAQHLTRHKTDCSTSKEIAQRAFEKGQKHKHKPPAKRKRTESTGGNASSSHRSLSVASSRSRMSVDAGEQDDVQMGLNEVRRILIN
jgi:hypothetical protein